MTKNLVIAIDFDDTFTADLVLWAAMIKLAQSRGHRVYCVTARRESEEHTELITEAFAEQGVEVPIVFSNLGSKMWTMEQRGVKVDIWIDDAPFALVNGL